MLTTKQIVCHIRSEDWCVTIDLKDAYFHISILPQHRQFLRFAFGGEAYQYRVLPLGLALSPRTFTKCVDVALAPLQLQGVHVLNYISDWLVLAKSKQLPVQHRDAVLAHMRVLGLRLNGKKSVLAPQQSTTFLGVVWDTKRMSARLSPPRIKTILDTVNQIKLGQSLTVKLMAAASNVIPFGLLYMRPLQWWLRSRGFSPRGNPFSLDQGHATLPTFLGEVEGSLVPVPRSSSGGSLSSCNVNDGCLPNWLGGGHECPLGSGSVERHSAVVAVFLSLRHFLPDLRGRPALVRSDNTAVVSYINRQGVVADSLSRQGVVPGEWRLHPEVVESLWDCFGRAQVDLFASQETTHCPLFFSLTHPASLGLDVIVQTWPRLRLYAFPPLAVLPGVLERVRRDGARLLLVAPFWPGRVRLSDIVSLLEGPPWEIPVRRDLLSEARGSVLHPRPELWRLWAWPLRGPSSLKGVYLPR
ncbi:uncharacterized protein [Pseudorasbora parva]|uniref:uncharacterized protein n=1 Tax=Pseudorasbora parva TaxID=51549 RepID=UPI00351E3881